jgi:hypothetical protein
VVSKVVVVDVTSIIVVEAGMIRVNVNVVEIVSTSVTAIEVVSISVSVIVIVVLSVVGRVTKSVIVATVRITVA